MLRSLCVFSVAALSLSFSAQAHAAKVTESFKLKNRGMSASFFGSDNCAAAAVNVFYSEIVTKTNGVKDMPDPTTFVELDYQNICTGDAFVLSGVVDQQQAHIGGNSGSASLYANVPVSNEEGTVTATLSVNLNWAATGPATTFKEKFKSKNGGVKFKHVSISESRPAEANGTIAGILPLTPCPKFTNLVFAPSAGAQINKNLLGEVTITKTKN